MASNLQAHLQKNNLPPLLFSNRTLAKGDPLAKAGAQPVSDFLSLVKASDIVFTMVSWQSMAIVPSAALTEVVQISDDKVLNSLVNEALTLDSLDGKIFVDTSTVHPDTSSAVSSKLRQKGASFIASPVFGASPMAAAGQLIFAMAGPSASIEKLKPFIVGVMGKSITNCGEAVSKSSLLKITG